jgi:hypothetical protein
MNNQHDDMYYIMNIMAAIALWPITLFVLGMALVGIINPLAWMGGFLIWFHKKINS